MAKTRSKRSSTPEVEEFTASVNWTPDAPAPSPNDFIRLPDRGEAEPQAFYHTLLRKCHVYAHPALKFITIGEGSLAVGFRNCKLDVGTSMVLGALFAACQNICEMRFFEVEWLEGSFAALVTALGEGWVKSLRIDGGCFSASQLAAVCEVPPLTFLSLRCCADTMTLETMDALSTAVKKGQLQGLGLFSAGVTAENVVGLSAAISTSPNLLTLDVSSNPNLGEKGILSLLGALGTQSYTAEEYAVVSAAQAAQSGRGEDSARAGGAGGRRSRKGGDAADGGKSSRKMKKKVRGSGAKSSRGGTSTGDRPASRGTGSPNSAQTGALSVQVDGTHLVFLNRSLLSLNFRNTATAGSLAVAEKALEVAETNSSLLRLLVGDSSSSPVAAGVPVPTSAATPITRSTTSSPAPGSPLESTWGAVSDIFVARAKAAVATSASSL